MATLTQERLKELLHYNPITGVFTNKVNRSSMARLGCVAGSCMKGGYRGIRLDNERYRASRLAHLYMKGYFPENVMDHIDRVKSNDKWANLRHVTTSCNNRNKGIKITNKSGVTGVSHDKYRGKWIAQIGVNNSVKALGRFITKDLAVLKRWRAEVKHEFPNCNSTSSAYLYLKEKNII